MDYLLNFARYVSRTPGPVVYGTTSNEAFHNQVKQFFNNRTGFTRSYARTAARAFVLRHLLRSSLGRVGVGVGRRPQDLQAFVAQYLRSSQLQLRPRLGVGRSAGDK